MKPKNQIRFVLILTVAFFTTNVLTGQVIDPVKITKDITKEYTENEGAADNYIHIVNKSNKDIYVEYDHDLIKRKYYGTWAPHNGWGKPYRPYFQGLNYTIYVKERGGEWSQVHAIVNCKKKSQLVTINHKNGKFQIKVTGYKS